MSRTKWIIFCGVAAQAVAAGIAYTTPLLEAPETIELFKAPEAEFLLDSYKSLYDNRLVWSGISYGFFAIAGSFFMMKRVSHQQQVKKILAMTIKQSFGQSPDALRITVFKKYCGFRCFLWNWLWKGLVNWKKHYKTGKALKHFCDCPCLWKSYLCIYARSGNPHQQGSSTFFTVPKESKEIESVAAKAWYSEEIKTVENLPNISNSNDKSKIKKYCKDTFMPMEKFNLIHRKSKHIKAMPIFDNDDPWAILVIDSDADTSPFSKDKQDTLNIISRTIANILLEPVK